MTPTQEEIDRVASELAAREPIFHRCEFGVTPEAFDRLMAADFSEIGASGRMYSREFVLATLAERHRNRVAERLVMSEFACRCIAPGTWLATYRLEQEGGRITRRSTLWRMVPSGWAIVHHQGTPITHGPEADAPIRTRAGQ